MTDQQAWAKFATIALRYELDHLEKVAWSENPEIAKELKRLHEMAVKECAEFASESADAMLAQMRHRFPTSPIDAKRRK